ncbi:uncharacterized protein LOC126455272 [Schistocerca serialis cubense]|uniref:uncharacterized protein LOC126455272 n=1 Tax=Schistocerca serialis cubense TaxID=2023355 RepID=UPI00214F1F4F|nr:uncharacterized protein LOC126455272 [Schistocerca serialis cubense]
MATSALPQKRRSEQADVELEWTDRQSAFRKRICTGEIYNHNIQDPRLFLERCFPLFKTNVETKHQALKINCSLLCIFLSPISAEEKEIYISSKNKEFFISDDIYAWYTEHVVEAIMKKFDSFQERDSGLALKEIVKLCVNLNVNKGFRVGGNHELPDVIRDKRAVVSIHSSDNECFKWAVLCALYPVKQNKYKLSNYKKFENELNFTGIPFPMEFKYLTQFERQNPGISVNVYGIQYDNGDWMVARKNITQNKEFNFVPIHISKQRYNRHANLLVLQTDFSNIYHFYCITNLSRLMRSSLTSHKQSIHFCERCLCYFYTEDKLKVHLEDCIKFQAVRTVMPSKETKTIQFQNYCNKEKVPFVVYGDIECMLQPLTTCSQSSERSHSEPVHVHVPYSVAMYVHCTHDEKYSNFYLYRGLDCMKWFTDNLNAISDNILQYFKNKKQLQMNDQDKEFFENAKTCHICKKHFLTTDVRVKDHCHFTGKFRGAAHQSCNLNYKPSVIIPVIFHNLTNYDAHFLIKDLCECKVSDEEKEISKKNESRVTLIPTNTEKYKSFTKYVKKVIGDKSFGFIKYRFIDSLNFLACSLEKCVSYMDKCSLQLTRKYFNDENQFSLVCQKGIFPYEYITDEMKLQETKLPQREHFQSLLTGETVSHLEYKRAYDVWALFKCKTIGDYSDIYLKSDVLLLADVFENFRKLCLDTYKLDPAHYVTSPGLAWDALLKSTNVILELITDVTQLQFVERGIRGGIVHCSHRHAVANNKYMKSYDSSKEESFIGYFDVNNLYGWAMMQYLPVGNFKWLTADEVQTFNVMNVLDEADVGYILEVDLKYPKKCHDQHQDFPLCPEKMKSPKSNSKAPPRLMCTLYDKTKYVLHYRNLKQSLSLGLELEKIHRILSFSQKAWMKPYIEINTRKRIQAKNDFEKNFFKLMNNSTFGKTMQNVRKMRDVRLVTSWNGRYGAAAYIAQPNFKKRVIFDESLVAIEMAKTSVVFDKPIAVGMTILDISKTSMFNFHYNYMLKKYPLQKVKMCYTDTDSFVYLISTSDLYSDIRPDINCMFDTSGYSSENRYNIPICNKRVIGLMKDEFNGEIVTEFIGLRAKMYVIDTDSHSTIKKAKGVKRASLKEISIDDYRSCILDNVPKMTTQYTIQSNSHIVHTIKQRKLALTYDDDKRYVEKNGVYTLPWGHYRIEKLSDV